MKVSVYGPNLGMSVPNLKGCTFHIHATDCGDRKRAPWAQIDRSHESSWDVDAASRIEVCDAVYGPGEFECESGEYLNDFYFYPCCKDLPVGEPAGSEPKFEVPVTLTVAAADAAAAKAKIVEVLESAGITVS